MPTEPKTWLVAYNLPTKSWSSGGAPADYDREHWDLFQVQATDRDAAERAAKEQRKRQRLTPAQRTLIESLFADLPKDEDPLKAWIEVVDPVERRVARALAAKGLLTVDENDARDRVNGTISVSEVRLTFAALNFW